MATALLALIASRAEAESGIINTINGSTSSWPISYYVGNSGPNNGLIVTNAGKLLVSAASYVGYNTAASNNTAIVTGSGSLWSNATLTVGYSGRNNRLSVLNGGTVWNKNNASVGSSATASGNAVVISGSGSLWANAANLILGSGAGGNSLTVSSGGAVVVAGTVDVGNLSGAPNNTVLLTGANARWNCASDFTLGGGAGGNQLSLTNGAVLTVGGDATVGFGFDSGADNNTALVTGSGSVWTNTGTLTVGAYAAGNRLTIANGGAVSGASDAWVGRSGGGNNNAVLVSGNGSTWANAGTLTVGGNGISNTFTITNSATASAGAVVVGSGDGVTGNQLILAGGSLTVTGTLNPQWGALVLNSGTCAVNQLLANTVAGGGVQFNGGTLSTAGTTVNNGAPFTVGNGTSAAALTLQGGTHTFANGLAVAANALASGAATVNAAVTNSGTVAPGASVGTLAIAGNYTQTAGGVLAMELGGVGVNDVLAVAGTAQLGGTLTVTNLNGFSAAQSNAFTILTAQPVSGTFGTVNLPALGGGLIWSVLYSPTSVVLRAEKEIKATYVATTGLNVAPYDTWAHASTTLQAAVDAVSVGGTVWVSNGVYAAGGAANGSPAMSNRVSITKTVTVRSLNGPSVTVIKGAADPSTGGLGMNATRCAYLSAGVLAGFTLTNGYTRTDADWNTQQGGGGALVNAGGIISNCVVTGCTASHFGGGLDLSGGTARNCTLVGNTSYDGGGLQLDNGRAYNCLIRGNRATHNGGGAFSWQNGLLVNCTVVSNTAAASAGGTYFNLSGTNLNTIVYFNTTNGVANNYTTNAGGVLLYSCTTPAASGTGNFTNNPQFANAAAGNYRLLPSSPCIDAGFNQINVTDDLGGTPRPLDGNNDGTSIADMGCYEYIGTPMIDITNASVTVSEPTTVYTLGGTNCAWVVGAMVWTNAATGACGSLAAVTPWSIAGIALARGANSITVSGTNEAGAAASDSVTITRDKNAGTGSPMHYVWTNSPAAAWPYTNWTTAAHTIQEAVETADADDTVLVTNGVYDTGGAVTPGYAVTNRVCVTRPITLRSVNGQSSTFIVGAADAASANNGPGSVRCLYIGTNAVASGFTLTNGYAASSGDLFNVCGGGALLDGGATLRNCTLCGNATRVAYGGGVFCYSAALVSDCLFTGNSAYNGGGAFIQFGGTVSNCVFRDNTAESFGGGAVCGNDGMLNDCLLYGNSANYGGGVSLSSGGTLDQCTVSGNTAASVGGGVDCNHDGVVHNSIVWANSAAGGGANLHGTFGTVDYTCAPGLSGSGNVTNDPRFVNAPAGNYRLQAGSPCVNAGNNASAQGATDLDGNPRIIGGVVDMGAYECTSGTTADGIPWAWLLKYGLATDGSADHLHSDTDTFDNGQEHVADTDPTNAASYFRITAFSNSPAATVSFVSSASRAYTLIGGANLVDAVWTNVPGAGPRLGAGGPDALSDTNVPPRGPFYRLKVELP